MLHFRKEEKQAENTEGKNSKTDDASLPWKQRKLPSFISLEHETSLDSTVNSSAISFEAGAFLVSFPILCDMLKGRNQQGAAVVCIDH